MTLPSAVPVTIRMISSIWVFNSRPPGQQSPSIDCPPTRRVVKRESPLRSLALGLAAGLVGLLVLLLRDRGLELVDALAQPAVVLAQLVDVVAQPAQLLAARRAVAEIADHLARPPPQPAVEREVDQALERADRRGIADVVQRFDRRGLDPEVAIV